MKISKSIISAATAAVLMAGFTGCSSDTNNVTEGAAGSTTTSTSTSTTDARSAIVNENEQAKYTAPIQGLVIDDRGQQIKGAKVTIGGQSTITDESGQYSFDAIDISAYVINVIAYGDELGGNRDGNALLVSIKAPGNSDMNDVVVRVAPQMIHVTDTAADINYGDKTEVRVTGDKNTLANSQSFVINSQVGTAMLVHKAADVSFDLRDPNTGVAIADGTKVIGMYAGVRVDTSNYGNASMTRNDNYITSVNSVVAYVQDGKVSFENLLTSSEYTFLVEGYTITGAPNNGTRVGDSIITVTKPYAGDEYVMYLGNLTVQPIVSGDFLAPRVASVANQFGVTGASSTTPDRLMLNNTVTDTITINFTEAVVMDDILGNIKVISNGAFLAVSNAEINGNQLTVTLTNPLTDGQLFNLLIMRDSRLRDLAGNELVFVGATSIDGNADKPFVDLATCVTGCESGAFKYLSCTMGSRAIQFDLMAYKVLSVDAQPPVEGSIAQMELDTDVVRTDDSILSPLEVYSKAFNNVASTDTNIFQLNSPDAKTRLTALAQALNVYSGTPVEMNVDQGRIKFTAAKATVYEITVPRSAGCSSTNASIIVTLGGCNGTLTADGTGTVYMVSGFAEGQEIELIVGNVMSGDKVVITPKNDYCLSGDVAGEIVLRDNVAPTTIVQNSYVGGVNRVVDGKASVVAFGEGGELTNGYDNNGELGVPALYLTPGLLDNLDESGNNILNPNNFVQGDETLEQELYVHNHADSNYTNVTTSAKLSDAVYDATAYDTFANDLLRDIGVSFSENIKTKVDPVYPTVTGYKIVNDIEYDDAGHVVTRDLISFTTSDVLKLANYESGKVMNFSGSTDMADNVSDNAKVKLIDGMPPMITRAIFTGDKMVVTFNEPIMIDASEHLFVQKEPGNVAVVGQYIAYNANDWTLNADKTVLTIENPNLSAGDFADTHTYDDSNKYDDINSGDYKHAVLFSSTIKDAKANSQVSWRAFDRHDDDMSDNNYADINESDYRGFSMISAIGDFIVSADGSEFKAGGTVTAPQKIVWAFNQQVRTNVTGEDFFFNGRTTVDSSVPADATLIDLWFTYNGAALTTIVTNALFTLSSDGKTITLTFTGPAGGVQDADVIEPVDSTKLFTSLVDDDQAYPLPSVNAVDAP